MEEVSRKLHAPADLTQYPLLDRKLDGPQNWSGRGGEERKKHLQRRESNLGRRDCSLVTIRLRYPGCICQYFDRRI